MKKVLCFMMCMAGPALAQELTDPVEILKKADAATMAVNSVKYDGKFEGLGDTGAQTPKVEGKAILDGEVNEQPKRWLLDVKVTPPSPAEAKSLIAGSDGESFFVIDTGTKKMYQDIDQAVLGSSGRVIRAIAMREYIHPTPFQDEIKGSKHELKGTVDVAGEKCYQIEVTYADPTQVGIWFFSTKDFLPRQVDRWFTTQDGQKRGNRLIVSNLQVDPKLDDKTFKPELPAGFEKVDDFAP